MNGLSRGTLFASSYAPLLVLFGMLQSFGAGLPTQLCFVIGSSSVALLLLIWFVIRKTGSVDQAAFEAPRSRDGDVMAYVVSYVVPFAAAAGPGDDAGTRWALALFAALIAVLYIRSAVFYVHPLLLLVGIHVYEATRDGVPVTLLTRNRYLGQEFGMRVLKVSHNVYLETSR